MGDQQWSLGKLCSYSDHFWSWVFLISSQETKSLFWVSFTQMLRHFKSILSYFLNSCPSQLHRTLETLTFEHFSYQLTCQYFRHFVDLWRSCWKSVLNHLEKTSLYCCHFIREYSETLLVRKYLARTQHCQTNEHNSRHSSNQQFGEMMFDWYCWLRIG